MDGFPAMGNRVRACSHSGGGQWRTKKNGLHPGEGMQAVG